MKSIMVILLFIFSVSSQAAIFKPGSGTLNFLAIGNPSAIRIAGKGTEPSGTMGVFAKDGAYDVSATLKYPIDKLETGISLRDQHMKEKYLEVGKFPTATLTIVNQKLAKDGSSEFEGDLQLHGVTKKIKGKASFLGEGKEKRLQASFPISLKDFAITIPSFAGITVSEIVNIDTEFLVGDLTAVK